MSKPQKDRTKVVVRKLPPGLTEDAFQAFVDKLFESTYDWFCYYPGKASAKKTVLSRAYLNFTSPETVVAFRDKVDGHVFISNQGNQYRCQVEYAPFQRIPDVPDRKDQKEGTIDADPDYQAFCQAMEDGPEQLPSAAVQLERKEADEKAAGEAGKVIVTPLMEYVRNLHLTAPPGRRAGKQRRADDKASGRKPMTILEEVPLSLAQDSGKENSSRSATASSRTPSLPGGPAADAQSAVNAALGKHPKPRPASGVRPTPPTVSRASSSTAAHAHAPAPKPEMSRSVHGASSSGSSSSRDVSLAAAAASSDRAASSGSRAPAQGASAREAATAAAAAAGGDGVGAGGGGVGGAGDNDASTEARPSRKVRAGFQAYVPKVRQTGVSMLDPNAPAAPLRRTLALAQVPPAASAATAGAAGSTGAAGSADGAAVAGEEAGVSAPAAAGGDRANPRGGVGTPGKRASREPARGRGEQGRGAGRASAGQAVASGGGALPKQDGIGAGGTAPGGRGRGRGGSGLASSTTGGGNGPFGHTASRAEPSNQGLEPSPAAASSSSTHASSSSAATPDRTDSPKDSAAAQPAAAQLGRPKKQWVPISKSQPPGSAAAGPTGGGNAACSPAGAAQAATGQPGPTNGHLGTAVAAGDTATS